MVCPNCGKEIPENSSYCLYCHAPTSNDDINVNIDILEDDELLGAFKKEEKKAVYQVDLKENKNENAPKKKKTVVISLVSFISFVVVAAVVASSYLNSYSYIISKADKAYQSGDYDTAFRLYEKAIDKDAQSVEALIGAGNSAKATGDTNKSESYLTKALEVDNENSSAYTMLLDLYTQNDEQEKIIDAEKLASTPEMKETYNEVAIEMPAFSDIGGEFTDDVIITLRSRSDLPIYYTVNGKDPANGNGTLYEGEIKITEGTTTVRACCYKNNTFGPVKEETFIVKYDIPAFPTVTPMNGSFTEETYITIRSDVDGAKIYYTWDGSTPSEDSDRYSGPIPVPEGNNVLSVIVVNSNGKTSDVLRCNYTYIPVEEETEPVVEEEIIETPGTVGGMDSVPLEPEGQDEVYFNLEP